MRQAWDRVMVETSILGVKSWRERKGISLESIAEHTAA